MIHGFGFIIVVHKFWLTYLLLRLKLLLKLTVLRAWAVEGKDPF